MLGKWRPLRGSSVTTRTLPGTQRSYSDPTKQEAHMPPGSALKRDRNSLTF